MKLNTLRKLKIKELSLVDRPANQGAESVLHKRDAGLLDRVKKALGLGDEAPLEEAVDKAETLEPLYDALQTSVVSILADDGVNKAALLTETVAQFRDELIKAVAPESAGTADDINKEDVVALKDLSTEELKSELAKREAIAAPVTKSVEVLKAEQERDELRTELAKMQTAAAETELVTLAKNMAGAVAVEPTALVSVLKKLDAPERDILKGVLDKHNALLTETALLKVAGSPDAQAPTADTLLAKAAEEIKKAEPTLSTEKAVAKALALNPALYTVPAPAK